MSALFRLTLLVNLILPMTAVAVAPFNRQRDLPLRFVDLMMEVAQHDLHDAEFVEEKFAISMESQFVIARINNKNVPSSDFNARSRDAGVNALVETTGDALPQRSGKFWNLLLDYFISPPTQFVPGVLTTAMVNIWDIEEYTCVTGRNIKKVFPDQNPVSIGNNNLGFRAYHVRNLGNQEISVVFMGPEHEAGCMRFLGIWQHNKL